MGLTSLEVSAAHDGRLGDENRLTELTGINADSSAIDLRDADARLPAWGDLEMEQLKRGIEQIRERLKRENNRGERLALQRLLFQEEYRIGFSRELLDCIDREIDGWKDWIERQQSRVQRLEATARVNKLEKQLLLLAQQTLAIHELHRKRIVMILAINTSSTRSGNGPRTATAPESTGKRGVRPNDEDGA